MTNKIKEKKVRKSQWQRGYEAGFAMFLRENEVYVKVGKAIVEALDDRYEFKKEDY